jgi:hypothetical protein
MNNFVPLLYAFMQFTLYFKLSNFIFFNFETNKIAHNAVFVDNQLKNKFGYFTLFSEFLIAHNIKNQETSRNINE